MVEPLAENNGLKSIQKLARPRLLMILRLFNRLIISLGVPFFKTKLSQIEKTKLKFLAWDRKAFESRGDLDC